MLSIDFEKSLILLCAFIIPFFINIKLTRVLFHFTRKFNFSFYREKRRILDLNKSRLGGLGILFSIIISFLIVNKISNLFFYELNTSIPIVIVFTSISFCLIGIIDDIFGLSPFIRLLFQFLITTLSWNYGLKIETIDFSYIVSNPVSITFPDWVGLLITILWIAGLTNAINWLDGQDGLAASFSSIAFFILTILFINNNLFNLGLLTLIATGSCLGFLKYNFHPSKIFMGDGGSYLLGSLLASSTLFLNLNSYENVTLGDFNSSNSTLVLISTMIFLIPVLDMISVISQRIIYKKSPFLPDKRHFHHILKDNGLNERDIVYFTSGFSWWLGVSTLYCIDSNQKNTLLFIFSFLFFLFMTFFFANKVKKFRNKNLLN